MTFPLQDGYTAICGHRGSPLHLPENTLAAFDAALDVGAELLEFDVRLAACGTPVVHHDRTLERMASRPGRLDHFTARELRNIPLAHHQHIPTLDEVIELAHQRANLAVEIKEHRALEPTLRVLQKHRIARDVLIMSFVYKTVRGLGSHGAGLHAGLLMGQETLDPRVRIREAFPMYDVKRLGASYLCIHHVLHHRGLAAVCKQMGIPVGTWTVNKADAIQKMLDLGVHMIITDFPELGLTLRGRR